MLISHNKTEPFTTILDTNFDGVNVKNYTLFMEVYPDDFAVSVLDMESNKIIALQVYAFSQLKGIDDLCLKMSHVFEENVLFMDTNFRQVIFAFGGNKSTLVPDPLYNPASAGQLLYFNHPEAVSENIHTDHLKRIAAKNIFAVPKVLENLIQDKFPQASVHHTSTAFIESVLLNNKNREEKIVTVHVHLTGFEIIVSKRNELILYNNFRYQSAEDFIYYVLFVYEQLQLNPESTPLIFTGAAERSSAIYITTQKYIRNIQFGERTDRFAFSAEFHQIPAHYHYILFNQHLCVS
jgi:hypothetical protein